MYGSPCGQSRVVYVQQQPVRPNSYGARLGLQMAVPQAAYPGQGYVVVKQQKQMTKRQSVYRHNHQIGYHKKTTTYYTDGTKSVATFPVATTIDVHNNVFVTKNGKNIKIGYIKSLKFVALK